MRFAEAGVEWPGEFYRPSSHRRSSSQALHGARSLFGRSAGSAGSSGEQPTAGGVQTIDVGATVARVRAGEGSVWALTVSASDNHYSLVRIDEKTGELGHSISLGTPPAVSDFAVGEGAVWVVEPTLTGPSWDREPGHLLRIDSDTGRVDVTISVGVDPLGMALGAGSVWVLNYADNTVSRVDPATDQVVATIHVGNGPAEATFGFGSLWVENENRTPTVMRIDPAANQVTATIVDVARPVIGDGVVWVEGPGKPNGAIRQIDPATNSLTGAALGLDIEPALIAAGEGAVWIGKWYKSPTPCPGRCLLQGSFAYRRFDPATNSLAGPPIEVTGPSAGVIAGEALWAPVQGSTVVIRAPI